MSDGVCDLPINLAGTAAGNTVSESTINGEFAFAGEMTVLWTSKSLTIIEGMIMTRNGMRPINPGEILLEEFLGPPGMTAHARSLAVRVR